MTEMENDMKNRDEKHDYHSRLMMMAMEMAENTGDYEEWKENFMVNNLAMPEPPPCSKALIARVNRWKKLHGSK